MTALRILVAEDDAMIAMFLSDLLEALGHVVCAAIDTEAATVAAALLHRPDLMIVDEALRDGSGIAAVQEIEMTLPVPHIFATGDCYRVLRAEGEPECAFDDLLNAEQRRNQGERQFRRRSGAADRHGTDDQEPSSGGEAGGRGKAHPDLPRLVKEPSSANASRRNPVRQDATCSETTQEHA